MKRAVKYPILVFLIAIVVTIVAPIFLSSIDPYHFGRLVGRFTVFGFFAAIIIGWISDRRHKKKNG